MEVIALVGLLSVGYMLTKKTAGSDENTEGFEENTPQASTSTSTSISRQNTSPLPSSALPPSLFPKPLYPENKTPAGGVTVPGRPRQVRMMPDEELDLYYNLPSSSNPSSNPFANVLSASAALAPQAPSSAVTSQVRMNVEGMESAPMYNSGKPVVSHLSGIKMEASDFTHNNMVPYYRGSVKQNMESSSSVNILDAHIGRGSTDIGKREQGPLFDPHREPTGNPYGMESTTDFMQDRIVAPSGRAGERPVEPEMVGPGINNGFSSLPAGGFQQFEINEVLRERKSVDDLRVASKPKISYQGQVIPGKSLALQRADLGETRKYRPDTFFINQDGERNFTTVGENSAPTERPTEIMKFQTRTETSSEFIGPAGSTDFKATYNVPSFRAPLVRQHDGFGYRNADGSNYGTVNTDAKNNDFGRAGYELQTNQRNVTSERGQALNLVVAGTPSALQLYNPDEPARPTVRETTGANDYVGIARGEVQKLTVYDPNDVARTTFREFIGVNDYVGIAGPASAAQKLTVYDPTDITKITGRNTLMEPDHALNVTRAGMPGAGTLKVPDGVRDTQKAAISARSEYSGVAGSANAKGEQVYDFAYAMRSNPTKEAIAAGRTPIAGNGSLGVFNGEDYINLQYRKIDSDSLNDRANTVSRIVGPPMGKEVIGLLRPKQAFNMDVAQDRNIHDILDTLSDNPYAQPIHKIVSGGGNILL
jgi:hypothetical protein